MSDCIAFYLSVDVSTNFDTLPGMTMANMESEIKLRNKFVKELIEMYKQIQGDTNQILSLDQIANADMLR